MLRIHIQAPEDLPVSRRRLRLLRRGTSRPRVAGPVRGSRQHLPASQHVPQPLMLRLPHKQRARAAPHHRHGGNRPGGPGQRLALRHGVGLSGRVGERHEQPDRSRKEGDYLRQSRQAAWHVGLTRNGGGERQRSSPPLMSIRHYQAQLRPDVRRRFYTKWDVRRTPACSYMALTAISWSSQRTDIRRICSMSDCIKK